MHAPSAVSCRVCGFRFPGSVVPASGLRGQASHRHLHCPRCRKIAAFESYPTSKLHAGVTGLAYAALGVTLAATLLPILNIYGLQLGGFFSLYGLTRLLTAFT